MWSGFWGKEVPYVGHISSKVMDCAVPMLCFALALLRFCWSHFETHRTVQRSGGADRVGGSVAHTFTLQLCILLPNAKVLTVTAQDLSDCMDVFGGSIADCFA